MRPAALAAAAVLLLLAAGCTSNDTENDGATTPAATAAATAAPAPTPVGVTWGKHGAVIRAVIEQAAATGDCTTFALLAAYAGDVRNPTLRRYVTARASAAGCDLT